MPSSQQPNVTICSPFRDSATGIAEYVRQLRLLDYDPAYLHYLCVEGDSKDDTWDELNEWWKRDARVDLVKCDTGKPKHGSYVDAERFATLATVFNAALDAVDYGWSDYVLFLPSDIRYSPDLLKRLLAVDEDIVSPFVWICLAGGSMVFYDSWAFSKDGIFWGALSQEYLTAHFGTQPMEMTTVGGVTLIKADVLRAGCRYTPDEVDRGLCKAAKAKGFTVWADPTTHVYHPPFAPEPDQGLTEIYSRDVERVKGGIQLKYGFTPPDDYVKDLIAFVAFMSVFTHDRE